MITGRAAAFAGVGALGILVQLATVAACLQWGHLHPAAGTALGVIAAVVHNFFWHRRWTWGDRRRGGPPLPVAFVRFALANGVISLAGNVAIVWILVRATPLPGLAANVLAIAICAAANYWASDRLVFTAAGSGSRI